MITSIARLALVVVAAPENTTRIHPQITTGQHQRLVPAEETARGLVVVTEATNPWNLIRWPGGGCCRQWVGRRPAAWLQGTWCRGCSSWDWRAARMSEEPIMTLCTDQSATSGTRHHSAAIGFPQRPPHHTGREGAVLRAWWMVVVVVVDDECRGR